MNLVDLRSRLRNRLQTDSDDSLFPDDVCNELLNEGLFEYTGEYEWPYLTRTARITTEAGRTTYTLPFDSGAVRAVKVDGYEYTPVGIVDADDVCAVGTYGVWADHLVLPDMDGAEVVVRYHGIDDLLVNDSDEPACPDQYISAVVEYAAGLGFRRLKQTDQATLAFGEYKAKVARHRRGAARIRGPRAARVRPGSMV